MSWWRRFVRDVTRPQSVAVVLGLVVIFAVAQLAGVGDGGALPGAGDGDRAPVVATDTRGVSWDVTGIIGGVFALLGAAFGLFGDRWLRYRGGVRCRIGGLDKQNRRREISGPAPFKADQSVQVHFFNEKEVDTGLSELATVFVYKSGEEIVLGPETRGYETSTSPRGVINLPSKTWVTVRISGEFYGPQAI